MKKALFFAVLLSASPLAAQKAAAPQPEKPPRPMPPFSESVDVSVTNVEVVVTDSKGRVAGLSREDFEVFQDGVPQKITNFYAVSGGKVTLEDGKVVALDSPVAEEVPRELKARYVIYVDNLNIQPQNRNRMFKRLKEFLQQTIGKRAEAMVVTFNRSLKVKRKFTSEANDIIGALEEIELETGAGTTLVSERRDALHRIDESRSVDEALQTARMFSRSMRNDLEFEVDALKNTLNGLAGLDGRKIFVYVSEGLPSTAGLELYDSIQRKYRDAAGTSTLEQFEFDMNSRYASVIQAANSQGVTIWALDASGLTGDSMMSAENRSFDTRPNDFVIRQNTQAPLQMMADQTGGMASINTNDWKKSLDELASDFSNFYSIGYRTTHSATDRPHALEIRVKRKGLRARFRKGFVEKTPETRVAEAVDSALDYARDDNPLHISVSLGTTTPYDRDTFVLPVQILLPIGKLGLIPAGDHYEGNYLVYLRVRDSGGDKSDMQIQKEVISVPAKALSLAQMKMQPYQLKLVVRAGAQRLSLAVRDAATNLTSYYQKNFFVSVLPTEKKKEAAK
ncbi:MAG TPA: VWA domain-containing protein [Thermoanaerobaculia bacterium]|nr:VWA domain-containing protein [Thermoanaerobaculia bacterium]